MTAPEAGRLNVLIIGATGYLGSYVAAAFAAAGHGVAALRRRGGRPARYRPVPGDLADPGSLTAAAAGFDHVVQVAAPLGPAADLAAVRALLAAGSPVIYTTGAAVLPAGECDEDTPPDPHPVAAGRDVIEREVLAAGGRVVRPGLVHGYGAGLVPGLLGGWAARARAGVYIGEPGTRWPAVHVADLAALYLAVAEAAPPGTVWHGVGETVRLDAVAAALGGGRAISWPVAEAVAELGPLADLFTRDQEVSAARTRGRLGWTPTHPTLLAELAG
jgi:nucleoside-diphosphate-sugar epimerase